MNDTALHWLYLGYLLMTGAIVCAFWLGYWLGFEKGLEKAMKIAEEELSTVENNEEGDE